MCAVTWSEDSRTKYSHSPSVPMSCVMFSIMPQVLQAKYIPDYQAWLVLVAVVTLVTVLELDTRLDYKDHEA